VSGNVAAVTAEDPESHGDVKDDTLLLKEGRVADLPRPK
jgi:hypothetical protein